MALAYSLSCSGTGPGSVRVSKISCTSCPAQWRSSAFLWESFLTPLASRKNSKERSQRRHLGSTLVGLPLQSNGLIFPNSMFTAIFGTFPPGNYIDDWFSSSSPVVILFNSHSSRIEDSTYSWLACDVIIFQDPNQASDGENWHLFTTFHLSSLLRLETSAFWISELWRCVT